MDDKRFSNLPIHEAGLYLWIIFLLIAVMTFYNYWIALAGALIFCCLVYYNVRSKSLKTREMIEYIKNLQIDIDSATKGTLLYFPLPMVVLQPNGIIKWYNSRFEEIFKQEELFGKQIQSLVKDLQISKLLEEPENISLNLSYEGKEYQVLGNIVQTGNSKENEYMIILYLIDRTELSYMHKKYKEDKCIEGIIIIDNYEEIMMNTDDTSRPQILAEIDRRLTNWVAFTGGVLKKYERDKYIFLFEYKYLSKLEERKFDILDEIREINAGNKIPVTLSIGIGLDGNSMIENDSFARAAIDIALGRGGDQVVIKNGTNLRFIGGKTKEMERRTKVKARVVAYALRELISQSEKVIIMGHQNGDMDSVGASVGLYRGIKSKGKDAYILLSTLNPTVHNLLKRFDKVEEYHNVFLTKAQAMDIIKDKTLLIIVDTHRPSYVEYPELLKKTEHIVIIDHHRRAAEFIENAVLTYHEPYASSTCEMVTEILQYMDDNIKLNVIEAEALYAGIAIDTKNFTFKTGVRTFEAASFLRRSGVDTISVKQLFQNDLQTYIARANIVKAAEIVHENVAISVCNENIKEKQLIIAQAADELLNISGIGASFVMCRINDGVVISGRSLGDINVQFILEKLGGGGHLTVAGAQLPGITLEQAREKLIESIYDYFDETSRE